MHMWEELRKRRSEGEKSEGEGASQQPGLLELWTGQAGGSGTWGDQSMPGHEVGP